MERRKFLSNTVFTSIGISLISSFSSSETYANSSNRKPIVISTWNHGLAANEAAWKILSANGRSLDAVEQGVMVSEADPKVSSVGYGGIPDRDGNVTLDACIMDEFGNSGSVCFLEKIMHPISVARKVMEKTPYIMLAGDGALKFALENGFKEENLLTNEAKKAWIEWKSKNSIIEKNKENHDTIGMLAIDSKGNMSGACTTSGLGYKMRGRVGDSPIIGAGLFVDNEVGGACATGKGEAVIKIAGSAIIVEQMRIGKSPQEACKIAIERIVKKQSDYKDFQVGFLAMHKSGETGSYSLQKGFDYALCYDNNNKTYKSESYL